MTTRPEPYSASVMAILVYVLVQEERRLKAAEQQEHLGLPAPHEHDGPPAPTPGGRISAQ